MKVIVKNQTDRANIIVGTENKKQISNELRQTSKTNLRLKI